MIQQETMRPAIKVYYSGLASDALEIKELFYGIEEEGIPFECQLMGGEDAISLAFRACQDSNLGTGIGVDTSEIVLHFEKLKIDQPLFRIMLNSPREIIRNIGANSARLVKKMPFRDCKEVTI